MCLVLGLLPVCFHCLRGGGLALTWHPAPAPWPRGSPCCGERGSALQTLRPSLPGNGVAGHGSGQGAAPGAGPVFVGCPTHCVWRRLAFRPPASVWILALTLQRMRACRRSPRDPPPPGAPLGHRKLGWSGGSEDKARAGPTSPPEDRLMPTAVAMLSVFESALKVVRFPLSCSELALRAALLSPKVLVQGRHVPGGDPQPGVRRSSP